METENKVLFRCSRLGDLMTGIIGLTPNQKVLIESYRSRYNGIGKPLTENQLIEFGKLLEKEKSIDISETAKTFVLDTFLQSEFGYEDVLVNDAMMKGLLLESEAIALVSQFDGVFYRKNKERRSNDWIIGELDVVTRDHIKDIKVSKSIDTFAKVTDVSKLYYWQAVGYMWLWNIPNYSLTYVLMPDTDEMVDRQLSRLSYLLVGEDYEQAVDQIKHNNAVINKLPIELRVKKFDFTLNEMDIDLLKEQITKARIEYEKIKAQWSSKVA